MHFTITKKIAVPFILMIAIVAVIGTISLIVLNKSEDSIQNLVNETRKEKALSELQSNIASLLITVNDFIITGHKQYYDDYNNLNVKIKNEISQLNLLLNNYDERKRLKDIENNLDSIEIAAPRLITVSKRNATDSIDLLISNLDYKFDDNIKRDIAEFIQVIQANANGAYERVNKEREQTITFIFISTLLALIISIVVVTLTMKRISKPILKLVAVAQRIAARDFTVELQAEENDEIGMLMIAFNAMVDEIGKRYEELENFSYIAAHDLKSPLTGVIGYAEILLGEYKDKIDPKDLELLHNIVKSGEMMASLITDLLEFATAGKVEFSKEPVSMNKMLNELKTELDYIITKRNVNLIIQENLPSFICDPARFPQIWNNLISNSIKYNDKPKPSVEIGVINDKKYVKKYCFFVKDNGIGIDESYFHKIFNPFQRATTEKKYEGTGIGLAIVKRIIEFHNGEIWVESKKGERTTFYFTIPKQLVLEEK